MVFCRLNGGRDALIDPIEKVQAWRGSQIHQIKYESLARMAMITSEPDHRYRLKNRREENDMREKDIKITS